MCGPDASSSWYKDANQSYQKLVIDHYTNNEQYGSILLIIIPTLTDVYFAGGEPFVQDGHYKLLKFY